MTDIELPYEKDRDFKYRFFEVLPGLVSWFVLALPFLLSIYSVRLAAAFVLGYLLFYFVRAMSVNVRALQGYKRFRQYEKIDWEGLVDDLEGLKVSRRFKNLPWHGENIARVSTQGHLIKPSSILQVAMIAMYNESQAVVEPTLLSVLNSKYDPKRILLVIAYEERGGQRTEQVAQEMLKKYGDRFYHMMIVRHPKDIEGEIIGKGGNITYAGRKVQTYLEKQGVDPLNVIVTTLDSDNQPHPKYFSALTYVYCSCEDPTYISFQPIAMYTKNIWDAPAPMRVLATGNTLWNVVLTMRPHVLRNFSAHAQGLNALIETDFWSVRTIVEDGHQFWRTYFRFESNHVVYPIFLPIYQDAVLADTYWNTLKAQFIQLRRWAWGASDVAYFAQKAFFTKNTIPLGRKIAKFLRLLEGHVNWAVAPLLLVGSAIVPSLINPDSFAASELPLIVSRVQQVALIGLLVSLFICLKTLPSKPARYKKRRSFWMVIQWIYMPVTSLIYSSLAALNSQTRLIFGRYLGKFDVTEKAVINDDSGKAEL